MMEQRKSLRDIIGKGYDEFWHFKGRYLVCKGSRASKKSKTTALRLMYMLERYPLANVLVVRKVFETLRDSCWSDFQWAALRLGLYDRWVFTKSPLSAVHKETGQQIFFRGLDNPQKTASISCPQGYLCWCWVEEAFEIDENDFDMVDDTIRGDVPPPYFKQLTLTFNPWSASSWLKKRFFDDPNENVLAMTTNYKCNEWLDDADIARFDDMAKQNPTRYKVAGLGDWGVDGDVFFDEWTDDQAHYYDRRYTHVIAPFDIPESWRIYRGFDFGYAKPFSVGWWAADNDGRIYRIAEYYGCTSEPNTGVKLSPDEVFQHIYDMEHRGTEHSHPLLVDRMILGVADPSIWDVSRGESIAEMAEKKRVYFDKGDNKRVAGWMQCHYRLRFDANGIPMMYVFSNCKQFIRTVPILTYSPTKPEDLNTDLEDHIADEWRYVCMAHPITPPTPIPAVRKPYNPLDDDEIKTNMYFAR